MGFNLTSFAGGFAEAAVEDIQKAQKLAAARGAAGAKQLAESYKSIVEENNKTKKELKDKVAFLSTYDTTATEDELFEIAKSKSLMDLITSRVKKDDFDSSTFKISNLAEVAKTNSTSTALERIDDIFKMPAASKAAFEEVKPTGNFFKDMAARSGSRASETAARETAAALGVSLDTLQASKGYVAPELQSAATLRSDAIKKQPQNVKDITDVLEVRRVQAAQQFGKDSKQVSELTKSIDEINSFNVTTDKTLDARANRLMIAIQDSKDPAQIKEFKSQLKTTQASIKEHKELTSTKSASEQKDVYSKMKTSVNDFVNNRMRDDKGFNWNRYYDFKTFTDPATGETITSRTQKAELKPEDQKVVFEKERQIMMSALKTNGYVLNDGTPRSVVAQEFMNNFNIKAVDLTVSNTPAPAPATTTPATATPAAAPAPVQSKAPSQQAIELLKANKTNADVVAAFEKKYPGYRAQTYIGQ
jgi:hypothetical protein